MAKVYTLWTINLEALGTRLTLNAIICVLRRTQMFCCAFDRAVLLEAFRLSMK